MLIRRHSLLQSVHTKETRVWELPGEDATVNTPGTRFSSEKMKNYALGAKTNLAPSQVCASLKVINQLSAWQNRG